MTCPWCNGRIWWWQRTAPLRMLGGKRSAHRACAKADEESRITLVGPAVWPQKKEWR